MSVEKVVLPPLNINRLFPAFTFLFRKIMVAVDQGFKIGFLPRKLKSFVNIYTASPQGSQLIGLYLFSKLTSIVVEFLLLVILN